MPQLIFILGPTAVGKSEWAIKWVKSQPSENMGILNCDSIQIYKDLNIGSAKPDFSKHPDINFYLFDVLKAPEVGTAGFFREKALQVLKQKLPQEKIIAVGGSGFYFQALEKGMYPKSFSSKPPKTNSYLSKDLSKKSLNELYQKLKEEDIETAKLISPKDRYRITRSLELIQTEGKKVSQIKKEFKETKLPWPYLKIGLDIPKEELLKRIQIRTQKMIQEGLVEEVEMLLSRGLKNWQALNSIGYKESKLYLEGLLKKEDLEPEIVKNTMRLAKKQKTWFKKDKEIQWFDWSAEPLKVYKQLFK